MGMVIAAPLGPIGTIVLRCALERGWWAGVRCGAGVACADLCFATAAAAGIHVAADWAQGVALVGSLAMLWIALRIGRSSNQPVPNESQPVGGSFLTAFALTIANPMTIISFAAFIAGAGNQAPMSFAIGIGCGSLLWWVILSALATSLGSILRQRMRWVDLGASCMIAGSACWVILGQIHGWLER